MYKARTRVVCLVAVVGILLSCLLIPAQAQQVQASRRRNIAALTDEAANIIHGTIVSVTPEPDPSFSNLLTVLVTIKVHEQLKGNGGKLFTFRQYIWDIRAGSKAGGYSKGQEVLLFMRPPSRYGLTSPAGLQQGQFVVQRDAASRVVALNGTGNVGLLDNLSAGARARGIAMPVAASRLASKKAGPIDLDTLKQVVRAFAGTEK